MENAKVFRTQMLLKITYALVPIIIGLDKCFMWLLVDWAKYTSPMVLEIIPLSAVHFVILTGVIEIFAGLLVWFRPRLGAYIIVLWMLLVIVDLASMNKFYDIIARDAVIGIGALALAWLTEAQE